MDLIIVSVQVPSLATAALSLLTSSCIKANMVKSINAYGHTTLGTPDLVQRYCYKFASEVTADGQETRTVK